MGSDYTSRNQLTSRFHFWSVLGVASVESPLAQLYLSRVGGEEEHDGEACQEACILDSKGEEEAAAARVFFLPTHLIHLRELRTTKQRTSFNS